MNDPATPAVLPDMAPPTVQLQTSEIITTSIPPTNVIPPEEPFYKKRIFYILIATGILIVILVLGGLFVIRNKSVVKTTQKNNISELQSSSLATDSIQESEKQEECNSPLAPPTVRPHVRCYYRQAKISTDEAKAVEARISQTVGSLIIPSGLVFEHEEVYRGIPIKWTKGQPISANTLSWLKAGIDILPNYFYVDHPVSSIISATDEELGSQSINKPSPDTLAYASGLNIFISKTTADGDSTFYLVDKPTVIQTLFHEWVHVVQHYEALKTFTEEYLARNTLVVAMATGPFEKGFAKQVGWVYNSDEFGDGIIAKLKDDSDSQMTTDYGKTRVREDMADSGALFMLCKSNEISEDRTLWWEMVTGNNRNEFCPSKI